MGGRGLRAHHMPRGRTLGWDLGDRSGCLRQARAGKSAAVAGGGPTAPPARLESSAKVGRRWGDRQARVPGLGFKSLGSLGQGVFRGPLVGSPRLRTAAAGEGRGSAQRTHGLVAALQATQLSQRPVVVVFWLGLVDGRGLRARRTPRV